MDISQNEYCKATVMHHADLLILYKDNKLAQASRLSTQMELSHRQHAKAAATCLSPISWQEYSMQFWEVVPGSDRSQKLQTQRKKVK